MSEKTIQAQIMLAVGKLAPNVRLFRHNIGNGVCGKIRDLGGGNFQVAGGRRVQYGLFVGSGDLIGWESITITPEMAGHKIARFLSIECKTPTGKIEPAQVTWAANVRAAGGKALIARSVDEAVTGVLNLSL